MQLVKKILLCGLVVVGVAILAVLVCAGILVIFPEAQIFGISFMNTAASEMIYSNIDVESYDISTIKVISNDFNINIIQGSSDTKINTTISNRVMGFTNSMQSNRTAHYDASYNDGVLTIELKEPNGVFFSRDTYLTLEVPHSYNGNIDVVFKTRNGVAKLGESETGHVNNFQVKNLTCTCEGGKGTINLDNTDVTGNLYIKNVIGRIEYTKDLTGSLTIDSKIGTFIFGKVKNLYVGELKENQTDLNDQNSYQSYEGSPAITIKECEDLYYIATSGLLTVNKYVKGNLIVDTKTAELNIATCVKEVAINGEGSTININQIGNVDLNNENYHTSISTNANITTTSGQITINKSYLGVNIITDSGKVTLKQMHDKVNVNSNNGVVDVSFNDGTSLREDTENETQNQINHYINEHYVNILTNYSGLAETLKITSINGYIEAKNIRNTVNIQTEDSQINLDFIEVVGVSTVKTNSRQISVNAPIINNNNYRINCTRLKTSTRDFKVNMVDIQIDKWKDLASVEGKIVVDDTNASTKTVSLFIKNADGATPNIINLISDDGAMIINSKSLNQ